MPHLLLMGIWHYVPYAFYWIVSVSQLFPTFIFYQSILWSCHRKYRFFWIITACKNKNGLSTLLFILFCLYFIASWLSQVLYIITGIYYLLQSKSRTLKKYSVPKQNIILPFHYNKFFPLTILSFISIKFKICAKIW